MAGWLHLFLLFFLGISILIIIASWFGARRRKHRWEKRYEKIKQEAIEREKRERINWKPMDWDRNKGIKNIEIKEAKQR